MLKNTIFFDSTLLQSLNAIRIPHRKRN